MIAHSWLEKTLAAVHLMRWAIRWESAEALALPPALHNTIGQELRLYWPGRVLGQDALSGIRAHDRQTTQVRNIPYDSSTKFS